MYFLPRKQSGNIFRVYFSLKFVRLKRSKSLIFWIILTINIGEIFFKNHYLVLHK